MTPPATPGASAMLPGDDFSGTAECSLPGIKESVALARSWIRALLEGCDVPGEAIDNAVLVLSELATNAAIHSRSSGPHGHYLIRLRRGVSALRLEVIDAGGKTEPRAQRNRHLGNGNPHPFADSVGQEWGSLEEGVGQEGGHGLALVEAFTTRWWTRGNEKGRTVGAELALNDST